jgi:hypothetical protein
MCAILQKQAREMVFKVLSYFGWEADNGGPLHDATKFNAQMAIGHNYAAYC